MGRSTGPSPAIVEAVWVRDEGRCARCGAGLQRSDRGRSWSVHHRRPRGMGGSRVAWVNLPSNLVLLCGSGVDGCHGWVEANRAEAVELGWLVSRIGVQTPARIPVPYWDGTLRLLDDEGGWEAL